MCRLGSVCSSEGAVGTTWYSTSHLTHCVQKHIRCFFGKAGLQAAQQAESIHSLPEGMQCSALPCMAGIQARGFTSLSSLQQDIFDQRHHHSTAHSTLPVLPGVCSSHSEFHAALFALHGMWYRRSSYPKCALHTLQTGRCALRDRLRAHMRRRAYHVVNVLKHIQHQHTQVLRRRPQGGHIWTMRIRTLVACQVQLLQVPVLSRKATQHSLCIDQACALCSGSASLKHGVACVSGALSCLCGK